PALVVPPVASVSIVIVVAVPSTTLPAALVKSTLPPPSTLTLPFKVSTPLVVPVPVRRVSTVRDFSGTAPPTTPRFTSPPFALPVPRVSIDSARSATPSPLTVAALPNSTLPPATSVPALVSTVTSVVSNTVETLV